MDDKIILDKETFKVLAAETRVNILKTLIERRHTQSELSAVLDLSVPTVKEHLSAMEHAELVRMVDEGRKWKYYELTKKGRHIVAPEEDKQFWIVLGFFFASLTGAIITGIKNATRTTFGALGKAPVLREAVQVETDFLSDEVLPLVADTVDEELPSLTQEVAAQTQTVLESEVVPTITREAAQSFIPLFVFFILLTIVLGIVLVVLIYRRSRRKKRH